MVAIGDSNTDESYAREGNVVPYTKFLAMLLNADPEKGPFVINKGNAGETTTLMRMRFPRDVLQLMPNYVIIQGGTNDAGQIAGLLASSSGLLAGALRQSMEGGP